MTANEYLDANRFPLTTQAGLSLKKQIFIDCFNHDSLKEAIRNGETLNENQKAKAAELEEKMRYRSALLAEIVAAEKKAKSEAEDAALGAPDPRWRLTEEQKERVLREASRDIRANEEYRRKNQHPE